MRSAVQSCVPLQESTAKRCVFFVYSHQACPEGVWALAFMALKASFQSDRNDDGQSGSAATGPDDIHKKPHRDSLNCFLGYNATGQKD